jgi:biofilm PGA synthesis protein PgaD
MSSLPITPNPRPSSPLIIERPDLQSGKQRAVFSVLTAVFWLLWVVLWLPLLTLFGWFFFGYQFHFQMIQLDGYVGVLDVMLVYALIILGMGGALLLWAKYNHLRFSGSDRRAGFAAPTPAELAAIHYQRPQDMAQWQTMNILTVHHDPEGRIVRVE